MTIKPRNLSAEEKARFIKNMRNYRFIKWKNSLSLLLLIAILPMIVVFAYGGLPLMVLFLGGFAALVFWLAKVSPVPTADAAIKKYNGTSNEVAVRLEQLLSKIDYYHTGFFGGIGVDVANGNIAIVNVELPPSKFEDTRITNFLMFSAKKITEYHLLKTDSSNIEHTGDLLAQGVDVYGSMHIINVQRNAIWEAKSNTGISFSLDDIANPTAFIAMSDPAPFDLVIKKLLEGSLEEQPEPMFIPYGKLPGYKSWG